MRLRALPLAVLAAALLAAAALFASSLASTASAKSRCRGFGPSYERVDFITVRMRGCKLARHVARAWLRDPRDACFDTVNVRCRVDGGFICHITYLTYDTGFTDGRAYCSRGRQSMRFAYSLTF